MADESVNNVQNTEESSAGGGRDQAAPLPDPAVQALFQVVCGAFPGIETPRFDKVYLFPEIESRDTRWGFVIVSRFMENGRLELAAYSYEIPSVSQGEKDTEMPANRKLESRRASIPAERLEEVIQAIVLRMDEIDNVYRVIDLVSVDGYENQLEYLMAELNKDEVEPNDDKQGEQHGQ